LNTSFCSFLVMGNMGYWVLKNDGKKFIVYIRKGLRKVNASNLTFSIFVILYLKWAVVKIKEYRIHI
jgi:hypothetical protein